MIELLLTLIPVISSFIGIIAAVIKMRAYTKQIKGEVGSVADKKLVKELIVALEQDRAEMAKMRRLLIEDIELNTKVKYGDSHDEYGNKKV